MLKSFADLLGKGVHKNSKYRKRGSNLQSNKSTFDFIHLMQNWASVVGPKLERKTYPLKITYGTLVILTEHPSYSQQLDLLSQQLLQQIFNQFPMLQGHIRKIKFQVSSSFFKEIERKSINDSSKKKAQKENHAFSPEYIKAKALAQNEFAHIKDQEMRDLLISLRLQQD